MLPDYLRLSLRRDDSDTYTPFSYNFNARQLHLPYLVSLAILGRPASTGMVSPKAILAASFAAGIAEEFLARDGPPLQVQTKWGYDLPLMKVVVLEYLQLCICRCDN